MRSLKTGGREGRRKGRENEDTFVLFEAVRTRNACTDALNHPQCSSWGVALHGRRKVGLNSRSQLRRGFKFLEQVPCNL